MTRCPIQAISAHARATPNHVAISAGGNSVTYIDLEQRSNQLASYLRTRGAGPEVCVGLLLDRSTAFVVAALAIMKTGAAYLPLDPSNPLERGATVLADAGISLLVTDSGKGHSLASDSWQTIDLDGTHAPEIANQPTTGSLPGPLSDGLAYVIYTSGSTGRPKGVEITHGNLRHLIGWHLEAFQLNAGDRASQVAGLGFDAAVWEIWPTLTAGASLHFADETTRRSPLALRDWLVTERITIAFVPTVLAEVLLHTAWPAETALRTMLTGADTLRRRPASGLPFTLVNNYGPTECTVVATSGVVTAEADGTPSIGRPIGETITLILSEDRNPVPAGEPGELFLAGPLVGRGYRNDPAETASRFITLDTDSGTSLRVYRTGDRVRLLEKGDLAFLGRLDDQIKIRGFRIEPGEIATALNASPEVEASVVLARDMGNDGPDLVAYVVAATGTQPTVTSLREFLANRLPDYMIPAHFVALVSLPINSSGKLDRAALPAPTPENLLPVLPPGATESGTGPDEVADLVASLLGHPTVDPQANFFLLGGHSMLAAQLVAQVRDRFGMKLTLRQLFNAPTVAALSTLVNQSREAR